MATALKQKPVPKATAYEADYHAWAFEQAALLRAGRFESLDLENMAEELESLGRTERHGLEGALTVLLAHMLKGDFQPGRRSRSWAASIREHRRRIDRSLLENPSLKPRRTEFVVDAYQDAIDAAVRDTNLPAKTFPVACPYDWDAIMTRPFEFDE